YRAPAAGQPPRRAPAGGVAGAAGQPGAQRPPVRRSRREAVRRGHAPCPAAARPLGCPRRLTQAAPAFATMPATIQAERRMAVTIGVARESAPGERRVALTPETCRKLVAAGATVLVERGLGEFAHFPDTAYAEAGAQLVADAAAATNRADVVLCVQPPPVAAIERRRDGAVVIGMLHPQADPARAAALQARGIVAFPLERLPRTTRAQAMDVLSSQAGMAGYKATLIAAQLAPRFFPMLTTAAGTIRPSRVLVVGAGVAGLQAIATARRLGAQVEGFDVRPETREQIESLGGRFLDLGVSAAGEGGYARALTDEERAEQQRRLAEHVRNI